MSGDLWVLCDGTNYATRKSLTTLYRLNGATGDLNFTREIPQPGPTVSLLSDLLHPKSGKIQYREGAALTRFDAQGEP